ncbi:dihydroorotate dehydrogenase electron transfer subunit [Fictibacillus macauensis ZFHKF-1]|uniref:Dihydroorotate dehydrogenase B (NAD(+)), electron transfer subunit n=1 Tax=Fictibacillus macauensis ZFHKF-1 TaxID=1196324 RepID=I8UE00_9BACL|nr:dihydroorotate dehydrogenase electron transfer subunit [Fictibacillus macauensis]EIT85023.1 dihydroorotate dehydrogenase electron transfer subunit [Fictibacillus macauensis ZFHKF-1]
MKKECVQIVSQREIAPAIYELVVTGQIVRYMTAPGQFLHVKVSEELEPLLRRPISICDVDQQKQTVTMLYRKEGRGTSLLSKKKPGDLLDLLGPLGSGFPTNEVASGQTALLIGGGIGVPPLYYLGKQLQQQGVSVISILGFASAADIFYEEAFRSLGEVYVSTVDGSAGTKGFVTDVLTQQLITYDGLYACGPNVMLRALQQQGVKGYISLEERMGCGIGACFACVCHVPNGASTDYVKVCSDGPVFKIGEVMI